MLSDCIIIHHPEKIDNPRYKGGESSSKFTRFIKKTAGVKIPAVLYSVFRPYVNIRDDPSTAEIVDSILSLFGGESLAVV